MSTVTQPFWDATRDGRLLLQWCKTAIGPVFYPRAVCPRCLGDELEWRPSEGTGRVYAVTVEHRPQDPRMAAPSPRTPSRSSISTKAPRLLTNVVGCDPMSVAVGMPVTVDWEPLTDGRQLPCSAPEVRPHA